MADRDRHPLRHIGRAQRKVDATGKVTGKTLFADDLSRPRMLHTKVLRSPHPHASIRGIDTTRARALDAPVRRVPLAAGCGRP